MLDPLLLGLLVAAIAIGWWLGRRERRRAREHLSPEVSLPRDYFIGLNHLLNEQPDQAIETFVQALEVNSDTIETHIALGNLFRSRGEADRAVKIHQNLLARPALTPYQGGLVQLELSRDFLNLGLLDRAERLLQALMKEAPDEALRNAAKRLLVDLLQREKEWQQALDVATPQLIRQDADIKRAAAHWLCELASRDRHNASPSVARKHLRQALSIDERCVRATWLLAELERDTGHYKAVIRHLTRIPEQDPGFLPIILEPLYEAYRRLQDEAGWCAFLEAKLQETHYTSVVIMLAASRLRTDSQETAIELISEQLQAHPSLRGVDYLMDLYLIGEDHGDRERLLLLKQHTQKLLATRPRHRCHRCGFGSTQLHWQCPRCHCWGTTKPIIGLEGE